MTVNGYYVGLMSGTSLDGIDAAVVHVHNSDFKLCSSLTFPWPEDLQTALRNLIENGDSLNKTLRLDQLCAQQYALATKRCIEQAGLTKADIIAIGSHGQTVLHQPGGTSPCSLQLGDPGNLAVLTGITVVADFRNTDMALGGQGAPLAPAFHQWAFACEDLPLAVINIGGIANVTLIRADSAVDLSNVD